MRARTGARARARAAPAARRARATRRWTATRGDGERKMRTTTRATTTATTTTRADEDGDGRNGVARADADARARGRATATATARAAAAAAWVAAVDGGVAVAGVYDSYGVPTEEATPLQNVFGVLFTGFSFWYFARAVQKRSGKAREFRVANRLPEEERAKIDEERAKKTKELTAMQSFTGGLTGIGISVVLYAFASKVSASFDGKALPESETVRQISITVRTIVEGLTYLATFVYAANGVGLIALAGQKTLDYFDGKDLLDQAKAELAERDAAEANEEKSEDP